MANVQQSAGSAKPAMTPAAFLRHRITYREPTRETDPFGQSRDDWDNPSVEWSAWARVVEQGSREVERAQQTVANATHIVTLRGDRAIKPTGRLYWTHRGIAHVLEIASLQNDADGDGSILTVICSET